MRRVTTLFSFVCLAACTVALAMSEQARTGRPTDEWRQRQAVQDANAIMQGMAQARLRREQPARIAR